MWINTGFYYYYFWVLACELYFSETTLVFISSLILGRKENNLFKMDVSSRYQPMYCSCTGEIVFWVDGVKKKNGGGKEKKIKIRLATLLLCKCCIIFPYVFIPWYWCFSNNQVKPGFFQICTSCCEGSICNLPLPRNTTDAIFTTLSPLNKTQRLSQPVLLTTACLWLGLMSQHWVTLPRVAGLDSWAGREHRRERSTSPIFGVVFERLGFLLILRWWRTREPGR